MAWYLAKILGLSTICRQEDNWERCSGSKKNTLMMSKSDTDKEKNVILKNQGGGRQREDKEKLPSGRKLDKLPKEREPVPIQESLFLPTLEGGYYQYVFWKIFRVETDKSLFSGIEIFFVTTIRPLPEYYSSYLSWFHYYILDFETLCSPSCQEGSHLDLIPRYCTNHHIPQILWLWNWCHD